VPREDPGIVVQYRTNGFERWKVIDLTAQESLINAQRLGSIHIVA
jgi:hypothetical protein